MTKGEKCYFLANTLFPICRSITGTGVEETLGIIKNYVCDGTDINFDINRVPSGTQVFDWTVPKEWSIKDGFIENEFGEKIVDFKNNNLHIMGYSTSVDQWVNLDKLKEYIFVQEDQPDVIPYVTSYYKERFGFCMSKNQRDSLRPGKYHMYIDSELYNGYLTYGEIVLKGKSDKEIFFSTYICHPSMANNECSGPALSAELIRYVNGLNDRKYTYRFVFIPETIGSITYLSRNLKYLKEHIVAGYNLSCVGDNYDYSIIETRYADTLADKVLKNVLEYVGKYTTYSFLKRGSDERQYNAPGVDLPVACFCRSKFGEFPEYHTSADNMSYVCPEGFQGSYDVMTQVIDALENNTKFRINVLCEPQLGKRGLYSLISQKGSADSTRVMTNFIAYADGLNDLIDISNRIHVPVKNLIGIVGQLRINGLLEVEE